MFHPQIVTYDPNNSPRAVTKPLLGGDGEDDEGFADDLAHGGNGGARDGNRGGGANVYSRSDEMRAGGARLAINVKNMLPRDLSDKA